MSQELLIQHHLKRLRLPAILNHHQKLAQEAAQQNLSYGTYLLSLLELEVAQREENQQKRRIAQARFPYLRALDQFDFSAIPSVNQARVLELARGEYLAQKETWSWWGTWALERLVVPLPWGYWPVGKGGGCGSLLPPVLSMNSWKPKSNEPWGKGWPSSRSWTC
jgi:hypothetical protein